MSTTLLNTEVALSKDIGDYWRSTTTGAGSTTTVVDTALCAKANDWITDESYLYVEDMTGDTYNEAERKISSLDNTTGTLTVLAIGGALSTSAIYRVHRLFNASDKRIALIHGARNGFNSIHAKVRNEAKRAGSWLIDGGAEIWASTSALTNYTASGPTLTQTSTTRLFVNGSYSCKLSGTAGYLGQSIANNDDLKLLRGQHVKFVSRLHSNTASSLRLAIYDGTTLTYSDYHPGNSAWDTEDDTFYVEADISPTATDVAFRWYHDNAAALDYWDDAYVVGPFYPKVYIHDLNLALDYPRKVSYFPYDFSEPLPITDYDIDTDYIYLKDNYAPYRLRIEGTGYLDFLASGVSSTAWTSTIELDEPQLKILSAEAAIYLYNQRSLNYTAGARNEAIANRSWWELELQKRRRQFGMVLPNIRTNFGI
jgi:hypothetical protein